MMSVITNSYSNVVSSFYGSKFQRNIEELLVSPTPNWIILLGYVVGGMSRGLGVGAMVDLACRCTLPTLVCTACPSPLA